MELSPGNELEGPDRFWSAPDDARASAQRFRDLNSLFLSLFNDATTPSKRVFARELVVRCGLPIPEFDRPSVPMQGDLCEQHQQHLERILNKFSALSLAEQRVAAQWFALLTGHRIVGSNEDRGRSYQDKGEDKA